MIPQKLPSDFPPHIKESSKPPLRSHGWLLCSCSMPDCAIRNEASFPPPSSFSLFLLISPHSSYHCLRLEYLCVCFFIVHPSLLSGCSRPVAHLCTYFLLPFWKIYLETAIPKNTLGRKVNWRPGKANELSEAVGGPHTSWSEAVTMSTVISISARVSSSHTELGSSDLRGGQ